MSAYWKAWLALLGCMVVLVVCALLHLSEAALIAVASAGAVSSLTVLVGPKNRPNEPKG